MFRGTLDDFTLPEILRMLAFSGKSGILHISRKAGTGRIVFSSGDVVYAETELSSSRLGQKLVGAGKITPAQLRQSLDEQATSGERLGRVLVEAEAVTRDDLEEAIRAQVEEAAYELMCWEAGEFTWEPGAEDPEAEVSLDIEELMRDVESRLEQRAEMQMMLSRPGSVPRMVEQAPHGPGDINIRPEQWRVLVLVDGRRTVGELAVAAGVAEADVIRTLNDLAGAGLIEVHGGPGPSPRPEPPPSLDVPVEEPAVTSAETAPAPTEATEPPEEWFEDPEVEEEGFSVAFPPPEPAVEDLPRVDRAAAVKELSGLFDDPRQGAPKPPPPKRHEGRDSNDSKGLMSRLARRPTT